MPVLSWWALVAVASRASATLTILSIFLLGAWLHLHGMASIGEIVTFTSFATMLIGRLEQVVGFVNVLFQQAAKIARILSGARHAARPSPTGRARATRAVLPARSLSKM